ncbi:HAD-IA family hydrolase [Croceicoccus mobilis]|uniref:Haloacid dehalogenase n=1 Tax=Croceicoccus mobilis TaxID=1703339 RepID=A0A916YQM2_9SPHN|nr:HAD-IA family hydrolase [Croceicoccus mobilis]GGD56616.1 haloacid dehalogenase [Croceicoccus mobilis]
MSRVAIFDCDGTLVDGQANVCIAMEEAFAASDLEAPSRSLIRRAVGLSLPQAMAMLLPGSTAAEQEMLAERYRIAFREHRRAGLIDEPLFDGMRELLIDLHESGWQLAVATGKSKRGLRHCLETHGIKHLFCSLQTADDHPSKPDPAMINTVLWDTGLQAGDAVMIGDTSFDMMMAGAAGVRALGVDWGYHGGEELLATGAVGVAETMNDLRKMIEGDQP